MGHAWNRILVTKREHLSGNREAVVEGARRLTYRELNRRVNRLAAWLMDVGLRHGIGVPTLSYNEIEVVELIFAAAKIGLILVPLNWRLAARELSFILLDSSTETLFFDADSRKPWRPSKKGDGLRMKRTVVIGGRAEEAMPYERGSGAGFG